MVKEFGRWQSAIQKGYTFVEARRRFGLLKCESVVELGSPALNR